MKLKIIVIIKFACYIFFDKFLGLVCFSIPFIAGKHGSLQHATLQVSNTQGGGNEFTSLLSLTCLHKYSHVFYGCSHRNVWIIIKYIRTEQFLFKQNFLNKISNWIAF